MKNLEKVDNGEKLKKHCQTSCGKQVIKIRIVKRLVFTSFKEIKLYMERMHNCYSLYQKCDSKHPVMTHI